VSGGTIRGEVGRSTSFASRPRRHGAATLDLEEGVLALRKKEPRFIFFWLVATGYRELVE